MVRDSIEGTHFSRTSVMYSTSSNWFIKCQLVTVFLRTLRVPPSSKFLFSDWCHIKVVSFYIINSFVLKDKASPDEPLLGRTTAVQNIGWHISWGEHDIAPYTFK